MAIEEGLKDCELIRTQMRMGGGRIVDLQEGGNLVRQIGKRVTYIQKESTATGRTGAAIDQSASPLKKEHIGARGQSQKAECTSRIRWVKKMILS